MRNRIAIRSNNWPERNQHVPNGDVRCVVEVGSVPTMDVAAPAPSQCHCVFGEDEGRFDYRLTLGVSDFTASLSFQ